LSEKISYFLLKNADEALGGYMSIAESIEIIFSVAKSRMKEREASNYVGVVITFCINRLVEQGTFTAPNLEAALEEEARQHLKSEKSAA
jgi:hypothetical protein